jgi:hypothetical protein
VLDYADRKALGNRKTISACVDGVAIRLMRLVERLD